MTKQEVIAKRCVRWMNDVIDIKNELYEPNEEMEQDDLNAIEDATFIIECIEKQIPKEAECHVSGNGWYGWFEFTCPVCGKKFKERNVCPRCYQRVMPREGSDNE